MTKDLPPLLQFFTRKFEKQPERSQVDRDEQDLNVILKLLGVSVMLNESMIAHPLQAFLREAYGYISARMDPPEE